MGSQKISTFKGRKCKQRGVGGQKKPKTCQRSLWTTPKYGFYKKSLQKDAPLTSWTLFFITKGYQVPVVLQVSFCDEKSVQLVRGASFRSDFLQNPYFKKEKQPLRRAKKPIWHEWMNQYLDPDFLTFQAEWITACKKVRSWEMIWKYLCRDIGICRHMNLVQTHKCSFLIMGLHIFQIKLC